MTTTMTERKAKRRTERLYRCSNGWAVGARSEVKEPSFVLCDAERPWEMFLIDPSGLPVPGSTRGFQTDEQLAQAVETVASYVEPGEPPKTCAA